MSTDIADSSYWRLLRGEEREWHMEPLVLGDLEAEFYSARASRDGARRQVRVIKDLIAELAQQIAEATREIEESQAGHDQMQRLANRYFQAGKDVKARAKIARRNAFGVAAGAARAKRRTLRNRVRQLNDQYTWIRDELDVPAREAYYCLVRHHMMVAISLTDEADPTAARERKLGYMREAGIPADAQPDDVYYYVDDRQQIHLFYGGTESPTGEGVSPDGMGHGHYVLSVSDTDRYQLQFARAPR